MDITQKQLDELEHKGYMVYADGGYPEAIITIVFKELGITVDGKTHVIGFTYIDEDTGLVVKI